LSALVRARFCELIARKIPRTQSDLFLVGMLSMMDAILDIPMSEVLEKIAIDQDTKSVLSGNGGRLQPVYELMLAQEAGDWSKAEASAATLRVGESEVGESPGSSGCTSETLRSCVCAKVPWQCQYLCAKPPPLWTCTEPAAQRSIREFPAAKLPALALRAP
jgi:hypothetical protein